jgi:hypothetical protein
VEKYLPSELRQVLGWAHLLVAIAAFLNIKTNELPVSASTIDGAALRPYAL